LNALSSQLNFKRRHDHPDRTYAKARTHGSVGATFGGKLKIGMHVGTKSGDENWSRRTAIKGIPRFGLENMLSKFLREGG
jgi:hypothetical protein